MRLDHLLSKEFLLRPFESENSQLITSYSAPRALAPVVDVFPVLDLVESGTSVPFSRGAAVALLEEE